MNLNEVYFAEISGFVLIGIVLWRARMRRVAICSFFLALLYPLGSYFFEEVRNWIAYNDSHYENLMFTILFPRIIYIVPIIVIFAIFMLFMRGFHIASISLGLAGALGFIFFGLYKWEQKLLETFLQASSVNFFEWEVFFFTVLAGILLILQMQSKKSGENYDKYGRHIQNSWILRGFVFLISGLAHLGVSLLIHRVYASLWIIPLIFLVGLSFVEPSWKGWCSKMVKNAILLFTQFHDLHRHNNQEFRLKTTRLEDYKPPPEEITDSYETNDSGEIYNRKRMIIHKEQWCASVYITKLPVERKQKQDLHSLESLDQFNDAKSWLLNYVESWNFQSYFMEFLSENGLVIRLGTYTSNKYKAEYAVNQIKHRLRSNFPSINVESNIYRIDKESQIVWNSPLIELKLPKAPYLSPMPLINNISQVTKQFFGHIRILIHFRSALQSNNEKVFTRLNRLLKNQKIDIRNAQRIATTWNTPDLFRIKVYFQQETENLHENEVIDYPLIGNLLLTDIRAVGGEIGYLQKITKIQRHALLKGKVHNCALVNAENLDFHFSHQLPVRRNKKSLPTDFISHKDLLTQLRFRKFENRVIKIGKAILDGEETVEDLYLPIDIFRQHISVFGLTRTGKSTLLANILHKVSNVDRNVSFLIFGLKDGLDCRHFKPDIIIGYDDANFQVPWVCLAQNRDGTRIELESLAAYIASAMGLLDNTKRYIINYLRELMQAKKGVPRDFDVFMVGILDYLERHMYGESQGDIYRAVQQHIAALCGDRFLNVVKASNAIPIWFKNWIQNLESSETSGKETKIYLDLRKFGESEKRFIVLAIFHLIQRFVKSDQAERLRRMLIIDEAHIIFYRPKTSDYYHSDTIGQNEVDKYLDRLINELGSTGTALVFADQDVTNVLDSIVNQVGTKILFRISRESAEKFTKDSFLVDILSSLGDHSAFVRVGPLEGEEVIIKTDPPIWSKNSSLTTFLFSSNDFRGARMFNSEFKTLKLADE